jgi:hypothetical protein
MVQETTVLQVIEDFCGLFFQVKINGSSREMLESAAEQFGGKEEQEIKNICLVSHFPKGSVSDSDPRSVSVVFRFV